VINSGLFPLGQGPVPLKEPLGIPDGLNKQHEESNGDDDFNGPFGRIQYGCQDKIRLIICYGQLGGVKQHYAGQEHTDAVGDGVQKGLRFRRQLTGERVHFYVAVHSHDGRCAKEGHPQKAVGDDLVQRRPRKIDNLSQNDIRGNGQGVQDHNSGGCHEHVVNGFIEDDLCFTQGLHMLPVRIKPGRQAGSACRSSCRVRVETGR